MCSSKTLHKADFKVTFAISELFFKLPKILVIFALILPETIENQFMLGILGREWCVAITNGQVTRHKLLRLGLNLNCFLSLSLP